MSNPIATIATNHGPIRIELFMDRAPVTAGNFIKLARQGFYNGLIFHRVIGPSKSPPNGFMLQAGCPEGSGRGGPGYKIKDEFAPGLRHDVPGILSMANAGPNTGGSQFFITLDKTPWLDGKHAIFGKVVGGLEIVRTIGNVRTNAQDRPLQEVKMQSVSVEG